MQFIGTKESIYMRKEFNSQRIFLVHQHGRRFIVLEHQYGRRDVMWKRSILLKQEREEEKRETGKEIVAMVAIPQADLRRQALRSSTILKKKCWPDLSKNCCPKEFFFHYYYNAFTCSRIMSFLIAGGSIMDNCSRYRWRSIKLGIWSNSTSFINPRSWRKTWKN